MKKLCAVWMLAAAVALALVPARPAAAAVTAEIVFEEVQGKLWAQVRLRGIAKAETFQVRFEWTAPDVSYTRKDGTKVPLFVDSTCTPEKPCGDPVYRCLCADTGERGCWRTRAFRTLSTTLGNGQVVRAVGTWKLRVLRVDTGAVLGEGSRAVE